MDSQDMCSEDEVNVATRSCFCRFPLPFICSEHLYKHPIDTDFFQHFLLPVYARRWVSCQDVKDQWKPWLFKLHSAYTTLRRNEEDLSRFEEELEAAKQEILLQIETEVNCKCEDAKKKIADLKVKFRAELEAAITTVSEHALEQWVPEPESLAALMWNFDASNQQSLKLFRVCVGKSKEKPISDYNVYIESSLPSLSDFNQIPEVSENKEKLEAALEEYRANLLSSAKTIEELTNERTTLISEIETLKTANVKLLKELTSLKHANSKLASDFECVKRSKTAEITPLSITLTKAKSKYSAFMRQLTEVREAHQLEVTSEAPLFPTEFLKPAQQPESLPIELIPDAILPRILENRLICYNVAAGQLTTATIPRNLASNSITCMIDSETVFCVGISDAKRDAYLLSLPSHVLIPLKPMSIDRFLPGIVKHSAFVYLFGGEEAGNTCEKLSISTRSWIPLSNMSCDRHAFTPCSYEADIYLPRVVFEKFNVVSEQFTVLNVSMHMRKSINVAFIFDAELVVITMDRQIGRWKVNSEEDFRVADLDMKSASSGFSNCTPVKFGRNVYWARGWDGALVRFNVDTQAIAEKVDITQ